MLLLALFLAACASAGDPAPPPPITIIAPPTLATPPVPVAAAAVVRATRPPTLAPPTATPLPTVTPALQYTADGPVTSSMALLGLAAEPFAARGDPRAPLTVVEFTDFGCPYCGRFHQETFPLLLAEYIEQGRVYYVVKDLPITSRHGVLAAQAAECGGEQGRYWPMHSALFAEQQAWYGEEADALRRIRVAALATGADVEQLIACVASEQQIANVLANTAEARQLQLLGTPAFFINGRLLAGAQPIDIWREILDAALAEGS